MELPITRQRLQNYRIHEAVHVERKKKLDALVKDICKNVEGIARSSSKERKFIFRINIDTLQYGWDDVTISKYTLSIEDLANTLKNMFIDCDILVDPLKTYILIDWS